MGGVGSGGARCDDDARRSFAGAAALVCLVAAALLYQFSLVPALEGGDRLRRNGAVLQEIDAELQADVETLRGRLEALDGDPQQLLIELDRRGLGVPRDGSPPYRAAAPARR